MNAEQQTHLEELANHLVTPERYGAKAIEASGAVLGFTTELDRTTTPNVVSMYPDVPETAKLYDFPSPGA